MGNQSRCMSLIYSLRMIALGLMLFIFMLAYVDGHAHVLDLEFRTPEWDNVERESREKECERAYDRYNEGSDREMDYEMAREWEASHLSCSLAFSANIKLVG